MKDITAILNGVIASYLHLFWKEMAFGEGKYVDVKNVLDVKTNEQQK